MVRLDTKPYPPQFTQGGGLEQQQKQIQQIQDLLDSEEPSSHVSGASTAMTAAADAGGGGVGSLYAIARVSNSGSLAIENKNLDETGSVSSRRSSNSIHEMKRSGSFGDLKLATSRVTGMENVKEEEEDEVKNEFDNRILGATITARGGGATMLQYKGYDEDKQDGEDNYAAQMRFTAYTVNPGDEEEASTITTTEATSQQQTPVLPLVSKIRFGQPVIIETANTSLEEDEDYIGKTDRWMMLRTCWEKGKRRLSKISGIYCIQICLVILAIAIIITVVLSFGIDNDDSDDDDDDIKNLEGEFVSGQGIPGVVLVSAPTPTPARADVSTISNGLPSVLPVSATTPAPAPPELSTISNGLPGVLPVSSPTPAPAPSETSPTSPALAPTFPSATNACFMGDIECEAGCVDVGLILVTDGSPSETSFTLFSLESDAVAWSFNTFESRQQYDYEASVCSSSCYIFQLNDEGGDGLTSWEGGNPAGYELSYSGALLSAGMDFGQVSESFLGGGCPTNNPTPGPTSEVTGQPTPIPTITAPQIIPACYPTDELCDASCSLVELTLIADLYSGDGFFTIGETSFKLYNVETGAVAWNYGPDSFFMFGTYDYTTSVCSSGCYRFLIEDSLEDGLFFGAGFWLYYQGELIASGGDFGAYAEAFFGEGCPN